MSTDLQVKNLKSLIALALQEDLALAGDITSLATIDVVSESSFVFCSRQKGVLSGTLAVKETAYQIDPGLNIEWYKTDGDTVEIRENIAKISGSTRSILSGERTMLNFLNHLSGISTYTNRFVQLLINSGSKTKIRDTRKTTPGYRFLEKQAVLHGGAQNHRMGLYDSFLIKDNHIGSSDILSTIEKCRELNPSVLLEVEVDSLDQLEIVVRGKPDLILLDNFQSDDVKKAINRFPEIKFEISGGVTLENLVEYGSTNVDFIAIGAITHSAPILDIGLDVL